MRTLIVKTESAFADSMGLSYKCQPSCKGETGTAMRLAMRSLLQKLTLKINIIATTNAKKENERVELM